MRSFVLGGLVFVYIRWIGNGGGWRRVENEVVRDGKVFKCLFKRLFCLNRLEEKKKFVFG